MFVEHTLRVGGDRRGAKQTDLNRLFEERTLRVGDDRRGAKQTDLNRSPDDRRGAKRPGGSKGREV